ncbi:putative DNA binding domain-containing protein [bacterium]|nr:putative DNA binding domain-containing protein [bacterium]
MNMNDQQILNLIRQGEGVTTEFKTCRNQLNRDVYESVCAFLNRHGGAILIGIKDSGEIQGVDHESAAQIKKDFVTSVNNPQKINPSVYLSIDDIIIDEKTILYIYVPESSQVHRCNGRIYDRNEDGDFDITDHTSQVATLYHRKQATYTENKIYPFVGLKELRSDLIERCRKLAGVWRDDHPWLKMDDLGLIKSAQLYQTDPETGKTGITLAGILLLGNDQLILTAVPHHRTDLILRKVNLDRYDDRDFVDTNLIESHDRIMAFVRKHLPDPFYLEGIERISIRDVIFREIATNILIHREFTNAFPAKLIIEYGQVRTENSNKPHGFGVLNPNTFTPFPKNPVISRFFRQIGMADELGSGMRKMMRYGKIFGGADPEMIEGDIFRVFVKTPEFSEPASKDDLVGPESRPESIEQKILVALHSRPLSKSQLAAALGHKSISGKLNQRIRQLLAIGIIEYTIPDKPTSSKQKYRLTEKATTPR